MPSPISSTADVWETIVCEAERESPLWAGALRPPGRREPVAVFAALAEERFAVGIETIYQVYLLHYGTSRLFEPGDDDVGLLLGDYLYAQGLVHISAQGDVLAVADLAELISLCASLRAEGAPGDGPAWAATAAALGTGAVEEPRRVLRETGDPAALVALAQRVAGSDRVEHALAAHAVRVG